MKRLLIVLYVLLIPTALAISTGIKPTYQQGETLITKISGNILEPINKENVELRRGYVQVPFEYDIKKIDKDYWLYVLIPKSENNYSLRINDISTTVNGVPSIVDFEQNFTTTSEIVPYSIKPAIIITTDDFKITINSNLDIDQTISTDFPESRDLILNPGENKLTFSIKNSEPGFRLITIGNYIIPVLIIKSVGIEPIEEKKDNKTNEIIEIILPEFRFIPAVIESVIILDDQPLYPFKIINTGETPIENIVFELNPEVFIVSPEIIEIINPQEEAEFILFPNFQGIPIHDTIRARSGDLEIELTVNITYTKNSEEVRTPYLEEEFQETQAYYCSEIGQFCIAGEVCDTETASTKDGPNCCPSDCKTPDKTTNKGKTVGYIIAAIVLIIIIIVVARYYKVKRQIPKTKKIYLDLVCVCSFSKFLTAGVCPFPLIWFIKMFLSASSLLAKASYLCSFSII